MGERILRPGIRDSERIDQLDRDAAWLAEVFFTRLLTLVDDYGRHDARPAILRTQLFPLQLDLVRDSDVSRCLTACEKAGLVRLYSPNGKPYLELLNFRQRMRAAKSKWPSPDNAMPPPDTDRALPRHCHDNVQTMPTETEARTETNHPPAVAAGVSGRCHDKPPATNGRRRGQDVDSLPGFDQFWLAYPEECPRKHGRSRCLKRWQSLGLEDRVDDVLAGLARWKVSEAWAKDGGQYIHLPMTFINGLWKDQPALRRNGDGDHLQLDLLNARPAPITDEVMAAIRDKEAVHA